MSMVLVGTIERRGFREYLASWLELFRVFNIPIPLAGMLVGAATTPASLHDSWPALLLAACLGCAAIQCFNDYEDRQVDRHNANWRPIPSGRLSPASVRAAGHGFILMWLALAWWHDAAAAGIVVIVYLLTRWYSLAKQVSLGHHLLLPAALGLMPIHGALLAGGEVPALAGIAGLSIFLIDINMNIVGAFKDLWAGSVRERVLPAVWGSRPAVAIALALALLGIFAQVLAIERGLCGALPLLPLALGAVLTVQSRLRLLRWPSAAVGYAALQSGRLTECLCFPALLAGLLPAAHALLIIGALTIFALLGQALLPEARLRDGADAKIE